MAIEFDANGDIRDQQISDAVIVVDDADGSRICDCTFTRCKVRLQGPGSRFVLRRVAFTDCEIEVVKVIKHRRLMAASFRGCKFVGSFRAVAFGRSDKPAAETDFGLVEKCDFSHAKLDDCRIYAAVAASLRFAPWPQIALIEPASHAAEVASLEWPGRLGLFMAMERPPSVTVELHLGPSLARFLKCEEEELRRAIARLSWSRM